MSTIIRLRPSVPFYEFQQTLDGAEYTFDVRWNSRDAAWYFSISENDGTPIVDGAKLVLGTMIGRTTNHTLFRSSILVAVDTSDMNARGGRDAGFDDVGVDATGALRRVQLVHMPLDEWLSMREVAEFPDEVA